MGAIRRIRKWRDRRHELIQLRHQLEALDRDFIENSKDLSPQSEEFEALHQSYRAENDVLSAGVRSIQTMIAIERALRWRTELPPRPELPDLDNEHWGWNTVVGGYHLTSAGMREIRHAVAFEVELFYKPWLSWIALAVSVFSLIVSLAK